MQIASRSLYVFENGLELRNTVLENVGMVSKPPDPPWTCEDRQCAGADGCGFGTGQDIELCGSRDDGHAEIFWIANPQNYFIGNVAVGGVWSSVVFR